MQVLEENNKWMMEIITQFASSIATASQPPPMLIKNVANVVNNNENKGNGESTPDPLLNTTNPSVIGNLVMIAYSTSIQSLVTKKELEKMLDQKNKSLNFLEFDLKLLYLVEVATKPYLKDYANSKFKPFNGKTSNA
ncbi:H0502G05.11 protein, putative [Theobroma cacao]|uniref:H0502G05.11 protein, putative n=1 Tax=Theobroma cacao TaxID=3641 RepID=A0A061EX79_THECC|nr:H0502G05.11 protein, putative [Theobroma cacao]